MGLPTTGTRIKTEAQILPSSALTDFSLLVVISLIPTAQKTAFFDDNNTTDGTRMRVANLSGVELPYDIIDFDNVTQTGLIRIKYTGTLPTTGTVGVYLYPPNTRNVSYAATDTYGQYNAYKLGWKGYFHNGSAESDRTINQITGTPNGGIIAGGEQGLNGKATLYYSDKNYTNIDFGTYNDMTIIFSVKPSAIATRTPFIHTRSGAEGGLIINETAPERVGYWWNGDGYANQGDLVLNNIWQTLTLSRSGLNLTLGVDDSYAAPFATLGVQNFDNSSFGIDVGVPSRFYDGLVDKVIIADYSMSASEKNEELLQSKDNATFWGNWSTEILGGTVDLTPNFDSTGSIITPLSILEEVSISPSFNSTGTITIPLTLEEALSLSPEFSGNGSICVNLSLFEDLSIAPVFDGSGEIIAPVTLAGELFISPSFSGSGEIAATLTIQEEEILSLAPIFSGSGSISTTLSIFPTTDIYKSINVPCNVTAKIDAECNPIIEISVRCEV